MITLYNELAQRIRDEVQDIERVIHRALRAWSHAHKLPEEQDVYLDSVALNLHGFYSGIEHLFELIARHIDHTLPEGETWHRALLHQMAHDLTGIRPAVIGQDSALPLDELRRFRHLVRNVYTMNLSPDKMTGLMSTLPGLWEVLRAEMLAFADFVEVLAETSEDK